MLVKNLVSVPGPPPFKNPGSAPGLLDDINYTYHLAIEIFLGWNAVTIPSVKRMHYW